MSAQPTWCEWCGCNSARSCVCAADCQRHPRTLEAQLFAQLLTPRQVAEQLEVSERTLARWRANRRLNEQLEVSDMTLILGPPFIELGRTVRYSQGQLERWVRAGDPEVTTDE